MTALRTVRRILVMHAPLHLSMRLMIVFEAVYLFVHIPQGQSRVIKNVCLQLYAQCVPERLITAT